MKITVAIAVYNGAATLQATLDSVFRQTLPPDEILVVNDGSTDGTAAILRACQSRITTIEQDNRGLSISRNVLYKHAQGDLIAFLDADDIWHPQYLETQRQTFEAYPYCVAFFTGHLNFTHEEDIRWVFASLSEQPAEVLAPAEFLKRYKEQTGPFASPSYCCVPKSILQKMGKEPFDATVRVCDDAYLFYQLALRGPIVYMPAPLAAYRLTPGSLSSNRLRNLEFGVKVFELLEERYRKSADEILFRAFQEAFAAKRREYAKALMGARKVVDAQNQLNRSLRQSAAAESICKGLALLFLSYMPRRLQPTWPLTTIR